MRTRALPSQQPRTAEICMPPHYGSTCADVRRGINVRRGSINFSSFTSLRRLRARRGVWSTGASARTATLQDRPSSHPRRRVRPYGDMDRLTRWTVLPALRAGTWSYTRCPPGGAGRRPCGAGVPRTSVSGDPAGAAADNTRADRRAGLSGPGADLRAATRVGARRTGTTGRADLCRYCGPAPASLEYVTGRWRYYLPSTTRRSWRCGRWKMFESSRQAAESAGR